MRHLPVYDEAGRSLDFAVFFGRFKIGPTIDSDYQPRSVVHYDLGETISLKGYDLPDALSSGQPLVVTLYWQSRTISGQPYTVFLHVTDELGEVVAQADGQPVEGNYPTDLWSVGEVISDTHVVPLPEDLSPGAYLVSTGLYLWTRDNGCRCLMSMGNPNPTMQFS